MTMPHGMRSFGKNLSSTGVEAHFNFQNLIQLIQWFFLLFFYKWETTSIFCHLTLMYIIIFLHEILLEKDLHTM